MKILTMIAVILGLILPTSTASGMCIDDNDSYFNGYCDRWGHYVPAYITNDAWMIGMPQQAQGKLVFYGQYSMDATAEYRGIDYNDLGCEMGGISLMSPIDIGKIAYLKIEGKWYGSFCVVDCARRGDMYSIVVFRDEVVEVNFNFAEKLGMVEKTDDSYIVNKWSIADVEVYLVPNNDLSKVEFPDNYSIDFSAYWLKRATYIKYEEPTVIPVMGGWRVFGSNKFWETFPIEIIYRYVRE